MELDEIIDRLKRHPNIRTKTRIAEICEVKLPSLRCWTRIPAEYVLKLENESEGTVSRYQMRPDVFGHSPDDDPLCDVG